MPVDFLTPKQQARYARFERPPSKAQLAKFFHFDEVDLEHVKRRRGKDKQLGFALQLGIVRFLGTFLVELTQVPSIVTQTVAHQLGFESRSLERYQSSRVRVRHTVIIQRLYGYRDFTEPQVSFRFVRWLYTRAILSAERPSVLFDLATARLMEHKILLPGASVLARLVARIRDRIEKRLWKALSTCLNSKQAKQLEELPIVHQTEHGSRSELERLRRSPTRISALALVRAVERLEAIQALDVGRINVSRLPPGRIEALARLAMTSKAQNIARMPKERRRATLLAFAQHMERVAIDDILELFIALLGGWLSRVARAGIHERLRTLKAYDQAAIRLKEVALLLVEGARSKKPAQLLKQIFEHVTLDQLELAANTVGEIARPLDEHQYERLIIYASQTGRFLVPFVRALDFSSIKSRRGLIEALRALPELKGQKLEALEPSTLELVQGPWESIVKRGPGGIDHRALVLCILVQLRQALKQRAVFVQRSLRYSDPTQRLLSGAQWNKSKAGVCRTLELHSSAEVQLQALDEELEGAYRRALTRLPENAAVAIEGKKLTLSPLDALEEPESLVQLRAQVDQMLPQVELPELLLEVDRWTGFTKAFEHVSEANARIKDHAVSVCAVLLAKACNIGLQPIVQPKEPALTQDRLRWVLQNYVRTQTLQSANNRLVDAQTIIPLARAWGGGEVASADGLRFRVPVRSLSAGPNPTYFNEGSGVTLYNFTSDQFAGFHGIVIPGTLRDSMYILEGLLEQQSSLDPREIMTDTAAYSDLVFGLFRLLGYQFSPRLADIGKARFYRLNKEADYGALNALARTSIRRDLITKNWEDMLRVAGSLRLGQVRASELVRSLQGGGRPTGLGRAIAEYGRIAKTLYLLAYIDDPAYRRRILTQLNRGESRHALARSVFFGQRGELHARYREGQEDQLDALGLVLNAIVLWNTKYMDRAIQQIERRSHRPALQDLERLSPLGHQHINLVGRYRFRLPKALSNGRYRPLRAQIRP